ncbi:MAG: HD domain-containing protein [Desulfuromonas sp.]|nr:HD domain-containing protein [Desulfuromonas sp.]
MSDLHQLELNQLLEQFFPQQASDVRRMVADVEALYRGEWSQWQACQVDYHNIDHVRAVLLAALRILAGYGMEQHGDSEDQPVKELVAAALFHDSGYIKQWDEVTGRGGQYTFEHVQRSQQMVDLYLRQQSDWNAEQRQTVVGLISATEIIASQEMIQPLPEKYQLISKILASADLLAQVADEFYLERLPELFSEFEEAYVVCGREALKARGIHIFPDLDALLAGSARFIRQQVLPRLLALGDMERYLCAFYARPVSPYRQRLQQNLRRFESFER